MNILCCNVRLPNVELNANRELTNERTTRTIADRRAADFIARSFRPAAYRHVNAHAKPYPGRKYRGMRGAYYTF